MSLLNLLLGADPKVSNNEIENIDETIYGIINIFGDKLYLKITKDMLRKKVLQPVYPFCGQGTTNKLVFSGLTCVTNELNVKLLEMALNIQTKTLTILITSLQVCRHCTVIKDNVVS